MSDQPIADHALLSDCHTAALVDRAGSVEWWCAPSFDSPSVFARLLDPDGGHFSIRPAQVLAVERGYRKGSLVLSTTFRTDSGSMELDDALAMAEGVRGHDLGRGSPHALLRMVRCSAGYVDVDIDFSPRFEYGLTTPHLTEVEGGVVARGGAVALRLSTSAPLEVEGPHAIGRVHLTAGEELGFALQQHSSWETPPAPWAEERIRRHLEDTVAAWRSWESNHQRYQGPYADLVTHSGRVLQGLTYQPTGAIVAAPTTSLPETVGGERNWDYRYSWVRDAAFALDALWVAACPDEAGAFLRYLATAASSLHYRRQMQIMFSIRGERDLTERELTWLRGWRDSRPVRVGNGAWDQPQLDVYGELLAAVHRLRGHFDDLEDPERRLLTTLADRAAEMWKEPDHGIWEIRREPRHYLYSKLMCWVALDRAVDLADRLGAQRRTDAWARAREDVRQAILSDGWSEEAQAFTQAFGATDLDASSLVIPIVGFLPAGDPRVLATVAAVQERLVDDRGLVYRYQTADGLPGDEGAFLLCTFWLAEVLATCGRLGQAREVFDRAASYANDVGLLSEEVDPGSGELLGNFPQAFSHIGLINAAWAISRAEEGES